MTTVVLDEANPVLRDMYNAVHHAMSDPKEFERLRAEATMIYIRLQGRTTTQNGKMVTLGKLVDLFGEKALPAIAMAERLDFLRLQPDLKRFLVGKPYWAGYAIDAAIANVLWPCATNFWGPEDGAAPADIRMAIAVGLDHAKTEARARARVAPRAKGDRVQ